MNTNELAELMPHLRRIAEQAGAVIMSYFSMQVEHELKGDGSPVSQADYAADRFIRESLLAVTPDIPVLTEETADEVSLATRLSWSRLWLVDPLDGTRHFIRGNEGFSVNIALVDQGNAIAGVVYAPVSQIGYSAYRSGGAWRWQEDGALCPIKVADVPDIVRVMTGFLDRVRSEKMRQFLDQLGDYRLYEVGSALKACLIAEGLGDVYPRYGKTSEWDTAASQIILEEAGGALVDLSGTALTYNLRETLENPYFIAFGQADYPWHFLRGDGFAC